MLPLHCPFCKFTLHFDGERSYVCENKHNFDLAKQGYLNLFPVNKKKSKSPGDSEMMVKARREFLEAGFYDPLMKEIKRVIEEEIKFNKEELNILDSGCGEGYYTDKALSNLEGLKTKIIGTDISKYAVKHAAGRHKENFYFVSSIYNLPVKSDSFDLILSVFSPNDSNEFGRVLNKNGYLIIVSPGENHMKQLAELIYDTFRPHEYNIIEKIEEPFEHVSTQRKTFEIEIKDSSMLQNLLKMTPYYWNTSKEGQEKIENCNDISIVCDFNITVFKK
ncbi:MAG: putative RNA methyltransferase [Flavobacteriales bacterium]